ncbi:MAG: archease [Desulfatiglandaceae bacterium]|jgi:SHS2 domain-containing protein
MSDFSIIDHTADLGLKVRGETLEKLFENAAGCMIRLAVKIPNSRPTETLEVHVSGSDLEDLLVRWLGEILYYFEGEKKIATKTRITSISPQHLDATLQIIRYDPALHELLSEIKAVTYHQIRVSQKEDRVWKARVIFDL